ncbi:MAG: carboxypeptidase-like regulatory domain-containing protein [Acidobacteriia bacterium]|nr:carboxypeptidase-like regulatory domain-containing protein [Terriglobia bacterium]
MTRRLKDSSESRRHGLLGISLLAVLLMVAANPPCCLFAQQTEPPLRGNVFSQGKALAEVKVTATNRSTGRAYTAFTDPAGQYSFLELSDGTYDVKAEKDRYERFTRKGIAIRSGKPAALDFVLKASSRPDLEKPHPTKAAPPPATPTMPPPPTTLTPTGGDQPRVTARSFLVGKDVEKDGYGLYSYLLFGTPPSEIIRNRYQEAIRAYLGEIQDVKSVQEYIPPQRLNVTYLPLTREPTGANPTPEWVLDSYNYARSEALLLKVPGGLHPGGPYLISTLTPLSKVDILVDDYLYLDLSAVPPGVILPWIKEFMAQASQQRFWEKRDYAQWVLKLRTAIEDMAVALPAVNKAGKDWKDLVASIVWHGSK